MVGSKRTRATVVMALIAATAVASDPTHAQPCVPAWSDQFSLGGFDSWIWDVVVHDDGNGPAVYAAGNFTHAGNASISYLARLDGAEWQPVGEPFDEMVWSLASCDDWAGLGPQLFAGGGFRQVGAVDVNSIARWDGTGWAPLGAGVTIQGQPYSWVLSMLFVPDAFGDGPTLFAGGAFDTAGATPALNIARWDGAAWSALGDGLDGSVHGLAWFDDGGGPALYAGGLFAMDAGQIADVARWDGTTWTPLSTGLDLWVNTLVVHDDGRGPALFAAGSAPDDDDAFTLGAVVRWDGVAWTLVGGTFDRSVSELGVFDVGGGPVLGASGLFGQVGSTEVSRIAAWDGVSWSPLGEGISSGATGMVSIPGQAAMYAGGFFHTAGGMDIERFARWDGSTWSAVGNGAFGDGVRAMEVFDDGAGPSLFLGGAFASVGGTIAPSLARWDGTQGTAVGGGVNGVVYALEGVTDPALGPGLYVGGSFDQAGETAVSLIARWDGTAWSDLAGGVNGAVRALRVFDDGTGPALYVGGDFTAAGGVAAEHIARWNGQDWAPVGIWPPNSTIYTQGLPGGGVNVLAVFDGALHAGGAFGFLAEGLARLDGDRWQPVGDGIEGVVETMKVFDDGSGPALFVSGYYCVLPDATACYLARWDGSTWSDIPMPNSSVFALEAYDDGSGAGPRLFAGGVMSSFADPALHHIAAWDGETWTALGSGVGEPYFSGVLAIAVFDDGLGDGDALYAGGVFETAGDLLSSNIARWGGCGNFVLGDLTGDGVVGIDDFTMLLGTWGPCADPCPPCPADLDGDCVVGIRDFLILLAHWS